MNRAELEEKRQKLKKQSEEPRSMPISIVEMAALGDHLSGYLSKVKPKLKDAFESSRMFGDDEVFDQEDPTDQEKKLITTIMKVKELDAVLETLTETMKKEAGFLDDLPDDLKKSLMEM